MRVRPIAMKQPDLSSVLASVTVVAAIAGLGAVPVLLGTADHSAPTALCRASDLRARAAWEGAPGELVGGIVVTNVVPRRCALRGRPRLALIGGDGARLRVQLHPTSAVLPQQDRSGSGILRRAQRAVVTLVWTNWCGGRVPAPITARMTLPDGEIMAVPIADWLPGETSARVAPCGRLPDKPSYLMVGPFTPVSPDASLAWIL